MPLDIGYWKWLAAGTKALRQALHLNAGKEVSGLNATRRQGTNLTRLLTLGPCGFFFILDFASTLE